MSDQINVNAIADTLNSKVQLPDGVGQDAVDFVVASQLPTAGNNYTWSRLYKSGWVEQGGYKAQTTWDVDVLVSLPITMNDANYTILTTLRNNNTNAGFANVDNSAGITSSSFYFRLTSKANALFSPLGIFWEVKGMSAQS